MKKGLNINPFDQMRINEEKDNLREYPLYPDSEDIYNQFKKEGGIDPEDISRVKKLIAEDKFVSDTGNESIDNVSGDDLDIPGSELDDDEEVIGSEDEENDYYSLGGDDHNDLEEDKDDM